MLPQWNSPPPHNTPLRLPKAPNAPQWHLPADSRARFVGFLIASAERCSWDELAHPRRSSRARTLTADEQFGMQLALQAQQATQLR